jgi:hypothetical protein
MDETGDIEEGQIYCNFRSSDGRNTTLTGPVMITRSPALHPGDIQIVEAVTAPEGSMLRQLYNVVVFSQHGARDLASQLSGGDLDGDQFDIVWDTRLIPQVRYKPADYPRASPLDIGREVTRQDMTNFFVEVMKNDCVGVISTWHMQLADRLQNGTLEAPCIELAEMASVAVDYAKTGITVDMSQKLRFQTWWKPDFMAPGPRVRIHDNLQLSLAREEKQEQLFRVLSFDDREQQFYESPKVLGQLFRQIDERGFMQRLGEVEQEAHMLSDNEGGVVSAL